MCELVINGCHYVRVTAWGGGPAGTGVGEPEDPGKRGRCLEACVGDAGPMQAVVTVFLERARMGCQVRLVGRASRKPLPQPNAREVTSFGQASFSGSPSPEGPFGVAEVGGWGAGSCR